MVNGTEDACTLNERKRKKILLNGFKNPLNFNFFALNIFNMAGEQHGFSHNVHFDLYFRLNWFGFVLFLVLCFLSNLEVEILFLYIYLKVHKANGALKVGQLVGFHRLTFLQFLWFSLWCFHNFGNKWTL